MKKLIKWIIVLFGGTIFLIILAMGIFIGANDEGENPQTAVRCSFGEINEEMWQAAFARAGAFNGNDGLIIEMADEFQVDPVLFAAIAFHETGWGTSHAMIVLNNPGGLMGAGGLMRFETLLDGLRVMGRTLHNHINERGATTLEALRDIYAPLGADNDPTGLNYHWVGTVTSIANQLGGLTMNCERHEGEFGMPVPTPFVITSPWGPRQNPTGSGYQFHNGIDFGDHFGTPIFSALDGYIVRTIVSNVGYGNWIVIEHDNGYWTLYAHLQDIGVSVGQFVRKGELIGTMGSTGNSTGPHLHFEVRTQLEGGQVNPAPYLGLE